MKCIQSKSISRHSPEVSYVWSMQEVEGSWQLDHYKTKKYSLTFLLVGDWNSWLIPIVSHSPKPHVLQKKWLFTFPLIPYYKYPYTHECRELLDRILREKPQKTIRLIHPQFYSFDSLNSSTLTFFIDITLIGALAKYLPHHIHISEKVIWCLGSSSERTNSFGRCNGLIAGFGKLEKTRLSLTLLEEEGWRV